MTTHQTLTLYSFSPVPSIGSQPAKLLGSTATDPLKARDSTLSGQWQNPLRCPSPSVLSIPPSRLWLQPFFPSSPSPFARNSLTFTPLSPTTTTPLPPPTTPHTSNMPRQRSGARPTAPARRAAPAPTQQQQTRPATTYAAPPASQPAHSSTPTAQAPTGQAPGLFAQMATTAAYVPSPSPSPDKR